MNRGLVGFVVFVSLVVIVLIAGAIYLGPGGLAFVLHDERKTAPFVMVNLLDFADETAEARYRAEYAAPSLALTRAVGGELLWEGRLDGVLAGRVRDEWPSVVLVQYPSRAAFIDLVTSTEYRNLADARTGPLARTAVLAASPRMDFEGAGGAFVLRLVRSGDDDWRASYEAEWLAEDEGLLERHGGRIAWRADLNALDVEEADAFDALWLYAFGDGSQRESWIDDIERRTVQSLERRVFRRDVLLLLSAAGSVAATPSEPRAEQPNGAERVELAEVRKRARLDRADGLEPRRR